MMHLLSLIIWDNCSILENPLVYSVQILARLCLFANGGSLSMIIGTFVFYFLLFIIIFSYPGARNKEKSSTVFRLLAIPAILGVIITLFTVIKVYFVYKLLLLLFGFVTLLLTYWQWGDQIRHWWR